MALVPHTSAKSDSANSVPGSQDSKEISIDCFWGALKSAGAGRPGLPSMLPCRLAEQVGGLLVADFGDSLAMALGGGHVPLPSIDGSQQAGEFLQAAEAEVEGHVEKRGLGGRRVSAPVGQRGGERRLEVLDVAGNQRVDIGIGHAALDEGGVRLGGESFLGSGDAGVVALDFGGGGGPAIDGPRQLERVGGSLNRMTDADSDFAAGAEVQVWHAAFKTLQAGDNECSIHKR